MASTEAITDTTGKVVGTRARWRDVEGKAREKVFRGSGHLTAARKYGRDQESARDNGEGLVNRNIAIGPFMREMLDGMRAAGMKPASLVAYTTHVKRLERHPTFAIRRVTGGLNETTVQNVVNWLGAPQPEGHELSPSVVSGVVGWIRRTARAAARAKLITYLTMLEVCAVERPTVKRPRRVPLTYAQVLAIADAMPPELRALVLVQVGTGLRIGELRGLRVQDITWPLHVVGGRPRKGWLHVDSQGLPRQRRPSGGQVGRARRPVARQGGGRAERAHAAVAAAAARRRRPDLLPARPDRIPQPDGRV